MAEGLVVEAHINRGNKIEEERSSARSSYEANSMLLEQTPSLGTAAVPAAVAPAPPMPAVPEPAAMAAVAPVARTGGAIARVTSGAIAPFGIFTQEEFQNMAERPTRGRDACLKQRELRARLLATADVREEDLTTSDFDWKA